MLSNVPANANPNLICHGNGSGVRANQLSRTWDIHFAISPDIVSIAEIYGSAMRQGLVVRSLSAKVESELPAMTATYCLPSTS